MKRNPVVLLAAVLLSLCLSNLAEGGVVTVSPQTQDPIQSIRQQYAAINRRAAKYKKVKKELAGFSLEGGEMVAYFDGPAIVKIVATHYGEMGRTTEEYYYQNGKLIFVFQKVFRYNKPLSGKVIRTTEDRYYFANNKLIRWINDEGKPSDITSDEAVSMQKEFLEDSNSFVTAAKSKKHTIEK